MRILFVDDELEAVSDHIAVLRQIGNQVDFSPSISNAYARLIESFAGASHPGASGYQLVVIDLYVGDIPRELLTFYSGLSPGESNDGQALGQWLWEAEGASVHVGRPIHCYFTNFQGLYRPHLDVARQEFSIPHGPSFQTGIDRFVKPKSRVRPSGIVAELAGIDRDWSNIRKKVP